jgi:hypothetical protein
MRNVIIPAEVQEDAINLCDVSIDNLVVAYSDKKAVGFVVCNDREWTIQTDSDTEDIIGRWYNTLTELARTESKKWPNFSLKVL